jgi:hypothetical protein
MLLGCETLFSIDWHHSGFGGTEPVLSSSNKQSRQQ